MLDDVLRQLPSLMDTVNQAATAHIRALSKWEKNTSSMSKAAVVIDFLGHIMKGYVNVQHFV